MRSVFKYYTKVSYGPPPTRLSDNIFMVCGKTPPASLRPIPRVRRGAPVPALTVSFLGNCF